MRNLFSFFSKPRGLPDSSVYHGGDHQHNYNQPQPPTASFYGPLPTNNQSLVPVGYHPTGAGGHGYNNPPPAFDPPMVHPYPPQQEEKEEDEDGAWEFNAGNNLNKKGQQRAGHIKVGNNGKGAGLPMNLPKNGRFVFNAGGNVNEGDVQEGGHIEFGNVRD